MKFPKSQMRIAKHEGEFFQITDGIKKYTVPQIKQGWNFPPSALIAVLRGKYGFTVEPYQFNTWRLYDSAAERDRAAEEYYEKVVKPVNEQIEEENSKESYE